MVVGWSVVGAWCRHTALVPSLHHTRSHTYAHHQTTKQKQTKQDDSELYIRNCERYGMKVDPSVVIALRTRWHVLQPTRNFCEGYLLPLAGILDRNPHIRCVEEREL